MINGSRPALGLPGLNLVCAVPPVWAERYGRLLRAAGHQPSFVADGQQLADRLARDWSVDAVVLDLDMAVPALEGRFGPSGPHLIAFGAPDNARIALDADRVDFIDANSDEAAVLAVLHPADVAPAAGVADLSDRSSARRAARGADADRVAAALTRIAAATNSRTTVSVAAVRQVIRARRARERFFPGDIFGDPAWDMLLDLFAASIDGAAVSVTSLCIAAAVPTSTALRWIKALCDRGIFDRRADPDDARRAFITLTPASITAMTAYFVAIDGAVAA